MSPFIEIALKGIAALLPAGALFAWLTKLVLQHELRLFAARRREGSGHRYAFAVFNPEDTPLEKKISISLAPMAYEGDRGRTFYLSGGPDFVSSYRPADLRVTARETPGKDGGPPTYEVTADRMPALSRWCIVCATDGREGDLALNVKLGDDPAVQIWGRAEPAAAKRSGLWPLAVGTLLVTLMYVLPTQLYLLPPGPDLKPWIVRTWETSDEILLPLLIAFSVGAFLLCWRRSPSVGLSPLRWVGRPSRERQEPTLDVPPPQA